MGLDLKNKNVLFIAPIFYDYHTLLQRKIQDLGAEVTFFPEKRDGLLFGVLNMLNPNFIIWYQRFYYYLLMNKIRKTRFSHFFLIRGYKIPVFFLKFLRRNNPDIVLIMYQWDSNKSDPFFHIIDFFDKVYTFDLCDSRSNNKLKLLELFYTEDIKEIADVAQKIEYDYFCFFSFTKDRYDALISFIHYCDVNNHRLLFFCYTPYTSFLRLKYLKGINLDRKVVSFKPMSREEYLKNLASSEVVVDFSPKTQSGLSMRFIEAIGANKKILTTNKSIELNPVFSLNSIGVLDLEDIKLTDFKETCVGNEYEKFYINNWIDTIFS